MQNPSTLHMQICALLSENLKILTQKIGKNSENFADFFEQIIKKIIKFSLNILALREPAE